MGYIIKELKEATFIRLKDFSIIKNNKEAQDLLKRNEAQQRTNAIIIIYSEIDFNDFYRKHCARIPNDNNEFTVLVKQNEFIPTRGEVRRLLEELLKINFKIEDGVIIVDIPEKYLVRKFYDNQFLSDPTKGCFRLRNINIDFPKQNLGYLKEKNILTEDQYNKIDDIWKSSFTIKGNYFFKKIWIIEHTDIIIKKKKLFF